MFLKLIAFLRGDQAALDLVFQLAMLLLHLLGQFVYTLTVALCHVCLQYNYIFSKTHKIVQGFYHIFLLTVISRLESL